MGIGSGIVGIGLGRAGNLIWDHWDHPGGIGSGIVGITPWELALGLVGIIPWNWIWGCWDHPGKGWELALE